MWGSDGWSTSTPTSERTGGGGWGGGRGFHHGVWGGKGHPKGKGGQAKGKGKGWTSSSVGRGLYVEEYDLAERFPRPYGGRGSNMEWEDI